MSWDPQTVRAYVDGELDQITSARLARDAERDPELAARIAAERRVREELAAHFAPILDEPMPARLSHPIAEARKVVAIEPAQRARFAAHARTLRWAGPAIAAALVLAMLVPGLGSGPTQTRDGLTFASDGLARALDRQLVADQRTGTETRVLLSFADQQGTLCRGFARADLSGIACREDGGWHLRVQRDGVDVEANDYRQASSVDSAIMAAAQDMAAGPALGAAQERAARARGWKAQ